MTGLHWIDWIIVALFLLITVGIGLYFTKRAGSNIASFFLTGRALPWYIAGTAWVASAFASDTAASAPSDFNVRIWLLPQ